MNELVLVDQEPIRNQARQKVTALHHRFLRLKKQIDQFEQVDQPAFVRWLHHEFREALDQTASLQRRLSDAEDLVTLVQNIRVAVGCSYYDAYVRAIEVRRNDRRADEHEADERHGPSRRSHVHEDFFENDDFAVSEDNEPGFVDDGILSSRRRRSRQNAGEHNTPDELADESVEVSTEAGAIEDQPERQRRRLYRELARILHPDLRTQRESGQDPWLKDLWLQTQAAYRSGDNDGLLKLLELCQLSSVVSNPSSLIGEILSFVQSLSAQVKGLTRKITALKTDMAWGFTELRDRSRLRRRIEYDLELEHDEITDRLDVLEAQLARWSVPPRNRAVNSSRSRASRPSANRRPKTGIGL